MRLWKENRTAQFTDIAEAKCSQELFTKQSRQKLKVLREHALIESAISSNRIEGVSEATILLLHRTCRGNIWDAGQYKDKDVDIIQKFPNGGKESGFGPCRRRKRPKPFG
ncbi:MAG: hypothetical protein ACE5OR_03590 [bacterium]